MSDQEQRERARRLETLLPRFSLDRRITVLVLVLTALVLGAVAMTAIPIELIPSGYSQPFLRVAAPWQDAPPQEVLDKITLPLEEELSTVRGLDSMFSYARTGYTQVFLTFKLGTDMDVAYREVRDRVERARTRMPDDLEQVFIRKDDDASFPVAMLGATVAPDVTGLYDLLEDEVVRRLERIDGVATVAVEGQEEKEILIELDRERVDGLGLNIYEIAQDLAKDNFTLASGNVRTGDRKLLLRSVARYRTPDSVGDLWVTPSVRLQDVATIRYDEPEKEYSVRVNSLPAFAFMVMKEGDANTLDVAARVEEVREELNRSPRLEGIDLATIFSQGDVIKDSLSTLLDSGRIGAAFAMLVLLFFLRRFRLSLIIALSIPLSMVIALVVMYFAGETLNVLSLLGLMISVGLLVDNAVVVAENIHRIYREGVLDRRSATIEGAGQIAMAITTATLTTIVVFLPAALVEGQGQFFLIRMALPISVALLASLGVALLVVPLAVYLTLPARDEEEDDSLWRRLHRAVNDVLRKGYDVTLGGLNRLYQRLLAVALNRRFETVLALLVVLAITQIAARDRVAFVAMSQDDQAFFEIDIEMPENMTFEESSRYFIQAEERIEALADELNLDFYIVIHRTRWGEIQGALATEHELTPRETMDRILAELPQLPGMEFHTGQASERDESDRSIEVVTLYGEDARQLEDVAEELETVYGRLPGVLGVKSAGDPPPNELALVVDRERAQAVGVNPQTLAGVVSYALRGQPLPRVYYGGRDIPVRVRFEEEDREGLSQLGSFAVPTESGEPVALSTLVEAEQMPAARVIRRRDKQTARRITLELEEGLEEEAREAIAGLGRRLDLPEGITLGARGRSQDDEELANLAFAAMLSVVFVYLLMGFLFESFLLPLAILVTVPLANIGVTWIHIATGRDIDFLGVVGLIILIGVVVNNGIVLLDYVRRLRAEGLERTEALLLATERRFRPIMMTALTTICGMVPLTLGGTTRMGLSYTSFGLTLIGGMVTSSLLTLLVVPVFYTLFEDARAALGRAVSPALRRRGSGAPTADSTAS